MTKEQAITLAESQWWKGLPAQDVVMFQLFEEKLCMDFGDFQQAVETALGRPVWTHEFADVESLRKEFLGDRPRATMEEILAKIPADKRVIFIQP